MDEIWTHHQRTINGFRMHYVTAGSGYPLVLLHGWPQSWYEWRKIIPALAEQYTVIAPDLRGLGDSEKPMSGYDKRTLAADVRALLAARGAFRAVDHTLETHRNSRNSFYSAHAMRGIVGFNIIPRTRLAA